MGYLIFLALVVNCLGQIIIPPEKQAAIDQLIDTFMINNHIPGLGLSIIKGDDEILYRRGYGMANVEASLPAHQGTLFAIGSITKVRLNWILKGKQKNTTFDSIALHCRVLQLQLS